MSNYVQICTASDAHKRRDVGANIRELEKMRKVRDDKTKNDCI